MPGEHLEPEPHKGLKRSEDLDEAEAEGQKTPGQSSFQDIAL